MGIGFRSAAAGAAILCALLMNGCYPAHCHNYAAGQPKMRASCAASLHFEGRVYLGRSVDIRVDGQRMDRVARIPPCHDQGQPCAEDDPSDYPTHELSRIPGISPHKAIIAPTMDRRVIYISNRLNDQQAKDIYDRAVEAMSETR